MLARYSEQYIDRVAQRISSMPPNERMEFLAGVLREVERDTADELIEDIDKTFRENGTTIWAKKKFELLLKYSE